MTDETDYWTTGDEEVDAIVAPLGSLSEAPRARQVELLDEVHRHLLQRFAQTEE